MMQMQFFAIVPTEIQWGHGTYISPVLEKGSPTTLFELGSTKVWPGHTY